MNNTDVAKRILEACLLDVESPPQTVDFLDMDLWDSMRMIELSFCIEDELGTRPEAEELRSLTDLASLVRLLDSASNRQDQGE